MTLQIFLSGENYVQCLGYHIVIEGVDTIFGVRGYILGYYVVDRDPYLLVFFRP